MRIAQINNNKRFRCCARAPSLLSRLAMGMGWRKYSHLARLSARCRAANSDIHLSSIRPAMYDSREFFSMFFPITQQRTESGSSSTQIKLKDNLYSKHADTFATTVIKIWFIEDVVIEILQHLLNSCDCFSTLVPGFLHRIVVESSPSPLSLCWTRKRSAGMLRQQPMNFRDDIKFMLCRITS